MTTMKLGTSLRFLFPTSSQTHEAFKRALAAAPPGSFIERPMGAYGTEEQARNSKHVASAAQRVSEHVSQISSAMAEQSNASQNLLRNADRSLDMCRQMAQAMDEQRNTGRYITQHSEGVTEMIRAMQASTASHKTASAAVAQRFEGLVQAARRSCDPSSNRSKLGNS